jgi:LysM repeat protein
MFDKTSVQDLQTQGSAMRLPNTTYAKNGGKLNVVPLPKFDNGGDPNKRSKKENKKIQARWNNLATNGNPDITEFEKLLNYESSNDRKIKINDKNLKIDKKSLAGDKSYLDNKSTTQNYIDSSQEQVDKISRTNAGVTDKMYRSLSKFFNTPADFDPYFKSNSINNVSNRLNSYPVSTPENEILYQPATVTTQPLKVKTKLDKSLKKFFNTPKDYNPNVIIPQVTNSSLDFDARVGSKNSSGFNKDNRERMKELDAKLKNPITATNTTTPTLETSQLESSRLFKAGQSKQKLSEALMYGMAALPSEQIKTITPDYGRGDDAMSRMGLSTEPIRQEMMQGANKALELTRSQVGTAGQLQSRGQSIMSNVGSQLAQSQLQQQQYLNQLRGALAQREDTKSNVLAQSDLTAREAKSAERAAKLDQLNNAISQTSAIGAGTMEQASKMSTIENENERFKRSQMQLMEMANLSNNFKVVRDKDGNISYEFNGGNPIQSSIVTPSLVSPPTPVNNAATVNNTPSVTPSSNAVVPVTTTGTTHTIKKGDTLYAIAKANNTTVSNLVKANGFTNDKALLLPGKTIKIK